MTHVLGWVFLTFMIAPATSVAQTGDISGNVFVDSNHNGIADRGERGVARVVVSNQDAVVTTDAFGSYRLPRGATGVIFISVPDGYQVKRGFWRSVSDTTRTVDFAVSPVTVPKTFAFIHASDTHIAQAVLSRTQRLRALADSLTPAFVLITGDLVRDALRVGEPEAAGYYELFAREMALFRSPVWTIPGNHEIFGIERDRSNVAVTHPLYGRKMYRHYRGPDYYSFNYGGVHFVGLNSVGIDDKWYYGQVDSAQLAWLERDLAMVRPGTPVVTFNHIPFFSSSEILGGYVEESLAPTLITVNGKTTFRHVVSNAGEVLALLRKQRHVLALGGHIHASEHIVYEADKVRTMFHQAPAIVGPRSSSGMQFPSGFTLYTVRDGVVDGGRFVSLGLDPRTDTPL